MEAAITFILSNFTLSFFVLGLVVAGVALLRMKKPPTREDVAEKLLAWFLFFSIGVSFFYNFVMHVFFGAMAAAFIGWADSPFQAEVGFASLGFAVVGFLAWRGSFGLRLAAVVGPACFLWGAAGGHVYQMITAGNFAPGNAGVIFYSDILIPLIGFGLLWWRCRAGRGIC
ncbi:MAG: DUF6790 family protein [Pseudomonadota bacterium]